MNIFKPQKIDCDLYLEEMGDDIVCVTFVTPQAREWAVSTFGLRFTPPDDLINQTLTIQRDAACLALTRLPIRASFFVAEFRT